MFTVEIDEAGLRRAAREGQAQRVLSAHRAVEIAATEGLAQSKARRRYKDRTGNLTRLATARAVEASPQGGLAEIVWPVPYAAAVDEGTKPHEIRPRRRTFLRFEFGGSPIFARKVNHPGTRPTGFAGDAAMSAERVLIREVEESFVDLEHLLNQ